MIKECRNREFPGEIVPTILYSKNIDVEHINASALSKLKSTLSKDQCAVFATKYASHPNTKTWATSLRIPESFECCTGAQVMVTSNSLTDAQIVNGTRGVVVEVSCKSVRIRLVNHQEVDIEYVRLVNEDDDRMSVTFMPLRLAYAITIHKSQGMTLDAVEMDLGSSIFEYGQAYTALSRARSLDSIRIVDVKAKSFKTHPRVCEFYKNVQ